MDQQKQQVIDRLKQANNVLVTVSSNPSIDQLAACIGLSLALIKLDKHATAVYSGDTPSTIEFLQPEETLEKNTDSLRDFIISLDKSKADKLRYKVEENVVRIFITPYRTSISDADLEFSQGDFNVDVVVALGVHDQKDLDQAITAHGRILHDATVITVNNTEGGDLGGMVWHDTSVSSLSEMATSVVLGLGKDLLDQQIATALLTGIVAETDRFSNEKTSADTMNASAALMAAGANQQLVATKLQEPEPEPEIPEGSEAPEVPAEAAQTDSEPADIEKHDGTLQIMHNDTPEVPAEPAESTPEEKPADEPKAEQSVDTTRDQDRNIVSENYKNPRSVISAQDAPAAPPFNSSLAPQTDAQPTAPVSPMTLPPVEEHAKAPDLQPLDDHTNETLEQIERGISSEHLSQPTPAAPIQPDVATESEPDELDLSKLKRPEGIDNEAGQQDIEAARKAVEDAMAEAGSTTPEPIQALNAQTLADNINTGSTSTDVAPPEPVAPPELPTPPAAAPTPQPDASQPMTMPLPPAFPKAAQVPTPPTNSSTAPPVPPPIIPPFPKG